MIDWIYPALTGVAVVAGFIDAIAGGGGLITVPALLYAGLPPTVALGTNKLQSCCGTALATYRYYRAGLFDARANLGGVACVLAGAAAGAFAIQLVAPDVLKLVVPVLLLCVVAYTVLSPKMQDHAGAPKISAAAYGGVAGGIGFYDGFFGPGTGQFFAISLVGLRGMGLTRATGLAKLFNLASNLASVVLFALGGQMAVVLGLCMAAGAMAGAWAGSQMATRLGARLIRPLLIAVSLALSVKLVWGWFAG